MVRAFGLYWGGFRFESLSTHHCWALSSSVVVWLVTNRPGTAQVGAISKAQKFSRNNYWETFQLSHSAEHTRKGFPRDSKAAPFLNCKHQKKLICLRNFFRKVFGKKSRIMPKKPKKRRFRPLKHFLYKLKTSKNSRWNPLIKFKSFRKSCIVPKKTQRGGLLVSPILLEA